MKKLFYFIAIASVSTLGFTSCSEDEPVMEVPTPNENPNLKEKLVVIPNSTFIKLGDTLRLKATSGNTEIKDAVFYVDDIAIDSTKYVQYTISEVMVHARRSGYIDSDKIKIQIAQKPF